MNNNKQNIDLNNKTILVTGSPGFIGAELVIHLLCDNSPMKRGKIISFDNMNDYYDPALKEYRLSEINDVAKGSNVEHIFIKGDIVDKNAVDKVFSDYTPDIVVHLAAQAGVRYSIDHPDVYVTSNIIGFYNILEACRHSYLTRGRFFCQLFWQMYFCYCNSATLMNHFQNWTKNNRDESTIKKKPHIEGACEIISVNSDLSR